MKTAILSFIFLFAALSLEADPTNPTPETALQGNVSAQLFGRWENMLSANELPDSAREENAGPDSESATATLIYHFRTNGTFTRAIDYGATHVEESGRWEVTADGQHLVLHFTGKEVEIAAIKYMELDEMVLEQSIRVPGANFRIEAKQHFFNKV